MNLFLKTPVLLKPPANTLPNTIIYLLEVRKVFEYQTGTDLIN